MSLAPLPALLLLPQSVAISDGYCRIAGMRRRSEATEFSAEVHESGPWVGRSIIRFRRRWGCCSCFRIALAVAPRPCDGWWSAWPPYYRWGIGAESRRQIGLCDRTDNPWVARPDTCGPEDRSSSRHPCIPVIRAAPPVRVTAER